jgi:ribosomal protein L14E/L6E/L27E
MTRKVTQATEQAHKEVVIGGEKNGSKRLVPASKAPRYYPAEDAPQPKKTRRVANPTRLRSSITPGTVLILLAGRFRGKRVVYLKQLDSGLLLVTGPFKINGVPLRRVNQAYVIATTTKVDLGDLQVSNRVIKDVVGLSVYRLTRKSTIRISLSLALLLAYPLKKNSLLMESRRRKMPSRRTSRLTKSPLIKPSSKKSSRKPTCQNILKPALVCPKGNSLISLYFRSLIMRHAQYAANYYHMFLCICYVQ